MIKDIKIQLQENATYMAEDVPKYVEKYMKNLKKKSIRKRRTDLTKGMIVVVLEGIFEAKRVVYLKKLENNMALCCGPYSVNGVPFFKIDEKYLLATSTVIDFNSEVHIDEDKVLLCDRDSSVETLDVEPTKQEQAIEEEILSSIKKVKFLKAYLSNEFEVEQDKDFYSLKY